MSLFDDLKASWAAQVPAIVFDTTGDGVSVNTGSPTTASFNHYSSVLNGVALVAVAVGPTSAVAASTFTRAATYDGIAMTSLGVADSGNGFVELFSLMNPTIGLVTVTVTISAAVHSIIANSATYDNVSGVSGFVTASSSAATLAVSKVSAPGKWWVVAEVAAAAISSTDNNQRDLRNVDTTTNAGNFVLADALGATSVTVTGTAGAATTWRGVGVVLDGLLASHAQIPGPNILGNVNSSLLAGVLGGGLIPSLDASKVTTGTFGTGLIPSLPASQITSGTFTSGLIPSLAASIITSGVFGAGLIPTLDGSKIASGTVASTYLPSTAWFSSISSSLLSGVLGTGLIPSLDASKITSGLFGTSQIPSLPDTQVPSLNNRVTALEGGGVLTQYTTNGTWTKPTLGADSVAFTANEIFEFIAINGGQGGGKGGNASPTSLMAAIGGIDGGAVSVKIKYSDLPATAAITIGAAGAGATAINTSGTAGGATSLGSLVTGKPGKGLVDQYRPGEGGSGAVTVGTTSGLAPASGFPGAFAGGGRAVPVAAGAAGAAAPAGTPTGGGGGAGGGVNASIAPQLGGVGGFPGGGGGAGGNGSATPANGSAGAAGCLYEIRPH